MSGAINFAYSDIYGGIWGTTEETIPEASDQNALVDDQKATASVSTSGKKTLPIFAALALVVVLAFIAGGAK